MPQFSFTHPVAVNGQIASGVNRTVRSRINELVAQVSRIAFGGNDDGTYTIQLESDGEIVTGTFVASSDAITVIIAGLITNFGDNILNIATMANNDPNLDATFLATNRVWTVTFPSNPSSNMTHTITTVAGGTDIPIGVGVVRGSADDLTVLPSAASTNANFLGISVRNTDSEVNDGLATSVDAFEPGSTVSVLADGDAFVETENAVTDGDNVHIRRVAAGTQILGTPRSGGDGTARVETVTPTAVNDQQYSLRIDVDADGNGNFESYVIAALGDASATATEICDDYRTQLAAISDLTGVVTGSGTATLILTGAAGVSFASVDLGPGVSAVVVTTAGTFETFRARNAEFAETTTSAGLAKVTINRPAN